MTLGWLPLVMRGPVNTMAVVVMLTMFLLREIEGSLAEVGHITMSVDEKTIPWRLPASKTDPQAKGCTQSWGCTCLTPQDPARECPYHTMRDHPAHLKAHFGEDAEDPHFPLFPTAEGAVAQGEAIVALVDELASRTGGLLITPDGQT